MKCDEARELLEAHHDGELTAETRSAVASHLRACTDCSAALAQLGALSAALTTVERFPVPDHLRRNVEQLVDDSARGRLSSPRRWRFGVLAASHVAAALIGGLVAYAVLADGYARAFNTQEVVSAHVRSLMGDWLVQVASSDTHMVRPWFAGKLDFVPEVRDFTATGFPLMGGRVDYVGGARVAALVYAHKRHIISVFVSPAGSLDFGVMQQTSKNGYTIVEWRMQDLRYRAVSDLDAAELGRFVGELKGRIASR